MLFAVWGMDKIHNNSVFHFYPLLFFLLLVGTGIQQFNQLTNRFSNVKHFERGLEV